MQASVRLIGIASMSPGTPKILPHSTTLNSVTAGCTFTAPRMIIGRMTYASIAWMIATFLLLYGLTHLIDLIQERRGRRNIPVR